MVKTLVLPLLLLCISSLVKASQISILVDDVGYRHTDYQLLELDPRISFALMPESPLAQNIAEAASKQGREVIIHMPMEGSRAENLGPYELNSQLNEAEFKSRLRQAIAAFPYAEGLNNHMGSKLTQDSQAMHWLMQELSANQMYFIDSRTHPKTVAASIAKDYQLLNQSRDVFLDHIDDARAINIQWQRALKLSKTRQHVLVIAHPRPATLEFLSQLQLPETTQLVSLNQILNQSLTIDDSVHVKLLADPLRK